jgi:hypothetical protein
LSSIILGNRCGHDPKNPAWVKLLEEQNFGNGYTKFRKDAARSFCRSFYKYPARYPTLMAAYRRKRDKLSSKQMRSELRDSICCTVVIMLESIDLLTLRIGIPYDDEFDYMKRSIMYKRAKDRGISKDRINSAIQVLDKAGLISVKRRSKFNLSKDRYQGFTSAVRFAEAFFMKLDLYTKLKGIRKHKANKQSPNAKRVSSKEIREAADSILTATAIQRKMSGNKKAASSEPPPDIGSRFKNDRERWKHIQDMIDKGIPPEQAKNIASKM